MQAVKDARRFSPTFVPASTGQDEHIATLGLLRRVLARYALGRATFCAQPIGSAAMSLIVAF
jgi:hypothetical protein